MRLRSCQLRSSGRFDFTRTSRAVHALVQGEIDDSIGIQVGLRFELAGSNRFLAPAKAKRLRRAEVELRARERRLARPVTGRRLVPHTAHRTQVGRNPLAGLW